MVYKSLIRSFHTIKSGIFLSLLVKIIATTFVATIVFSFFFSQVIYYSIGKFFDNGYFNFLTNFFLGQTITSLISWFLFPTFLPLIAIFFEDDISEFTSREYGFAKIIPSFSKSLILFSIKSSLILILWNLLLLPFYFIPICNLCYYPINSFLLGKFFMESVCARFEGFQTAKGIRKKYGLVSLSLGFTILLMSNIPVLNLFSTIIAIITANHIYFNLPDKLRG